MAMDSSDFSRIIQSTALISMISRKSERNKITSGLLSFCYWKTNCNRTTMQSEILKTRSRSNKMNLQVLPESISQQADSIKTQIDLEQ